MTKRATKAIDPKGTKLPGGNPTIRLVRKVDPETLTKRLQPIYRKLVTKGASRSALLSTLTGDNRHRRWSVRILLKMKLVEAVPESAPKEKRAAAKKAVVKATRKIKPEKKAPAKAAEKKPEELKPPVA